MWKIIVIVGLVHIIWSFVHTLWMREERLMNEHRQMDQKQREYFDFSVERVSFWKEFWYHFTFRSTRQLYEDAGGYLD